MVKKKILVIDDMPNIVTMVKARLGASGYEVITATDGEQGLSHAYSERPDLIILDVVMPAGGGYSVYSKLRMSPRTRSIPVIFLTAKDRPEDEAMAHHLGVQHYIKKPYKPEKLLETVKKVLEPDTPPQPHRGLKKKIIVSEIPLAIHPKIQSMAVSGSGFLGNLNLSWNPNLNVIIGGKGTGKSAILESLRYVFGIMPYSEPSQHKEMVLHALGRDGRVEVILDRPLKEGKIRQYRIVRAWGEEPHTFQINPDKPLALNPSELINLSGGISILGQREIYAISKNDGYRVALLDEWIGEESRKCANAFNKSMESLTNNAKLILEMQAMLVKKVEYRQRLKKIDQEIDIQKGQFTERPKEMDDLRGVKEHLQNVINVIRGALSESDQRRLNLLDSLEASHRNLLDAQDSHPTILKEGAKVLAVLQESLKVVLDDETTLFEQAIQSLTRLNMRCQEKPHPVEKEIDRMEQDTQRELLGQDRLLKLEEEKKSLASLIGELNGIEDRLKALRQKREGLFQHIKGCRELQNRLRRERADILAKSLHERLQLQIEFKGQKGSYKESLSLLLKGSNLSQESIERLVFPEATDGITLAEAVRSGSREVQIRFGLNPESADGLVQWLTAEESRLFELETLVPQDSLLLKLKIDGQYQSFDHLSVSSRLASFIRAWEPNTSHRSTRGLSQ
jgi:CheY-like chemotaxis protein